MEGDEMEMSKEELQEWIREKVEKSYLISTALLEKSNLLQSLLERREKQAAHLLKLCQSVAACEAIVKKQYSLLGWEYRDTDSDDDDNNNITGCGNTPPAPREFVRTETQCPSSPTTNGPAPFLSKLDDKENLYRDDGFVSLERQPVVVLTRLPSYEICSLRVPRPQNHDSEWEWESSDGSDSDEEWTPYSSSYNTGSNKRRKMHWNEKKLVSTHTNTKSNTLETSTSATNGNGEIPVSTASTLCQSSDKATKIQNPPSMPEGEISVNMNVLARRKAMRWQRGKVMEILTRAEDGRLKYKINFEEKGKSLVSGHHIAFEHMPKLEQLFVGARVVVKPKSEKPYFCPGVLAELPTRKNQMRFLIFMDNHTPVYVNIHAFRLVYRPLTDPLDDIPDDAHKNFMKTYLKFWPFPPQVHYSVGQIINAELNGVQQRCEVQEVDSSLIRVAFQKDQHKEWIFRGSMRLEHMLC